MDKRIDPEANRSTRGSLPRHGMDINIRTNHSEQPSLDAMIDGAIRVFVVKFKMR
jgi:hypothetical protein